MEIKISNEQANVPIVVMHVDGNLDFASMNQFQAKAEELINQGARYILVDLAKSPFVSSAGLRALNQLYKQLRAVHPDSNLSEEEVKKGISAGTYKSPHLKLVNVSSETRTLLSASGFDMYIEIFDNMKTAIASF
ncbi:MAG: STAS domain-containing protein [Chloroflexi bacterium]|nr:STAS domain-containing protein [Chloroflexota bacterium]